MKMTTQSHLEREKADFEAGLIPASLTSANIIKDNISGATRLIHSLNAIDMSRAKNGLPITWMRHKEGQIVGRAINFRLDGDVTRADFKITRNEVGRQLLNDIEDGIITDVSIGADILDYEMDDDDVINITRWSPYEVTTGTVVADVSIGINRNKPKEEKLMTDKTETQETGTPDTGSGSINVLAFEAARQSAASEAIQREKQQRMEANREINKLFSLPNYQSSVFHDLNRELIERGASIEEARKALTEAIGSGVAPIAADFNQDEDAEIQRHVKKGFKRDSVSTGKTDVDKYSDGVQRALEARVGLVTDRDELEAIRRDEFSGMNMAELSREYCRRKQIPIGGLTREQIVGAALQRDVIGHSTSDFANVLENVATKSLLQGWDQAEETWTAWARVGSLPDFKQATRVGLSSFSDLDIIYENGEYKEGTRSDLKEPIQLVTYGKLMSISRQALINDDLSALSTTPRAMGLKANRKIGDVCYDLLYSNSGVGPTLNQDSTALWDAAGHSNYVASGAAPSVTTMEAAFTALATQTDPGGETMAMPMGGWTLLVPWALRGTARALMTAEFNPAEGTTTSFREPNTVRESAAVVTDARLDTNDAAAWYLLGNPNQSDTFEVAFLNGQQTPYLEQQDGFTTDGIRYKVRIDAGVAALDYRRVYKNNGN